MPKLKTKSGAKKRFGLTGTGKVKRNWGHKRHLLINKSKQGKRLRRGTTTVTGGTPAEGGTSTRSSGVPLPGWFARNVSGMMMVGSGLPL